MTVMMTVKMILMPVKMIVITVMVKMAHAHVETSLLFKDTPVLDSNSGITFGGTFLLKL